MKISVALIGDYNETVIAHQAIPLAISLASKALTLETEIEWIPTESVEVNALSKFDAIWCVPASPYKSMDGALSAIKFARENNMPFLGTCGGYQHAALEYARNVLGYEKADNAEVNSNTEMPLISALACKLVEKTDSIFIDPHSIVATLYRSDKIDEDYHCSFGVNREYLSIFNNSEMSFTGKDDLADPRVLEIADHKFFIGTAYQPERSALKGQVHPVIVGFLKATMA